MIFRSLFLVVASLFFSFNIYSQKNSFFDLSELVERYPDEKIVQLKRHTVIDFEIEKDKVYAYQHTAIQTAALRANVKSGLYEFYSENSEVTTDSKRKRVQWKGLEDANRSSSFDDYYYSSSGIFHSDARVKSVTTRFNSAGEVKVVNFYKKFTDLRYMTTFYFGSEYPAEEAIIELNIPDWLDIEIKEFNFEDLVTKSSTKKNGIQTIIYKIKQVPVLESEYGLPGVSYKFPHLLLASKKADVNGNTISYFENLDGLYGWYASLVKDVENDNNGLKTTVAKLTAGIEDDEVKMRAIFEWVQQNIRYIAFEQGIAGFKPATCQDVFSKKYGDCKGMANLTKEMLKIAGFDARLAWLGTNSIVYDYSTPSLSSDNHMICVVMQDGQPIYLDATEKYADYQEIAERIQNRQVLIEDGASYLLKSIPSLAAKTNASYLKQSFKIEGEKLLGNSSYKFNGEAKSYLLNRINSTENEDVEDAIKSYLSRDLKNCSVANVKHSKFENLVGSVDFDYEMEINNSVSSFGKELYVNLDFYTEYKFGDIEKEFTTDYYLPYKEYIETNVELEVPAGHTVSSLPDPVSIKNDEFSISAIYETGSDKVTYQKRIVINDGKISKSNKKEWNQAIKALKDSYENSIILKQN